MTDKSPYHLAPQTSTGRQVGAFTEPQGSPSHHDGGPMPAAAENEEFENEPVTLGLTIRRTRLVAFTLIMLLVIVGFTLWFHHGIALSHFDSLDKSAAEQTKLLDDYNSYSGNVATIFATPVELFVTVAVQVIVLRFMADTFTRPEMSWKISATTLLLGAAVGYLISNGFNALNVQLRPERVVTVIAGTYKLTGSLPVVHGLLPEDDNASESTRREFFVPAVIRAAARQFAAANRTKTSDIAMEFSHTQIAPHITFEAVTFETEVDPELLATNASVSADGVATRYTVLDQAYNCPGSSNCLVRKPIYTAVGPQYDPPAQVVAFLLCTNADGAEAYNANVTIQNYTVVRDVGECVETVRRPGVLIVSIAKRLVADALEQNVSLSRTGEKVYSNVSATVTNLRKVFSFTVGRLGWKLIDLDVKFNAECDGDEDNRCLGLELPLSPQTRNTTTLKNDAEQWLLVGKSSLDDLQNQLAPVKLRLNYAKRELISLNEPPHIPMASSLYQIMAGDLLLAYNVRNVTWDDTYSDPQCDIEVEYRIRDIYARHHYMEYSLQAAYTSATFFLFERAVVRDVISLSPSLKSLALEGNSQAVAVWISTPSQNMWLTLGGCFVLIVGLFGALVKSMWFAPSEKDALAHITEPHAIARVMMDERHYPPIFLHRRIVEKGTVGEADEFAIAGLSLQQQQQQQRERDLIESRRNGGPEVAFIV